MNFLAHIYLSGDDSQVIIGNFIADGIHGKKYTLYPWGIQKGILLHRAIDTYTDTHPIFRKSTKRLHEKYSHYSGVIVDIFYDHFLAKNWNDYSNIPLEKYSASFYELIQENIHVLPLHAQRMVPHMVKGNWLLSYKTVQGIENVLQGMDQRTKYNSKMNESIHELKKYYNSFELEFTSFFEELIIFSKSKLMSL
ncbi:acyl carrier protein phosphodiesterase [Leptobacterium sp. I13]|uniref:acyl carrier protein phosphodiesterase n=1 Tax=Leptobacterium meishanense TaxID=3128904 RepID=UPI0030EC56A6